MRFAAPLLAWVAGMLVGHGRAIFSGLELVPGDPVDPRYVNYVLEHSWRWISGAPGHERFFDPPFFYPLTSALGYSDAFVGAGPLYWPFRAVGIAPDTSYQLFILACSTATFAACYALYRAGFGLGTAASSVGAVLATFGAPRLAHLIHPQLLAGFWPALALLALARLVADPGRREAPLLVFGFLAAAVLTLYSSFYLGWFLGIAVFLAAAAALCFRDSRAPVLDLVRRRWGAFLLGGAAALLAVAPAGARWLAAARSVGGPSEREVHAMLPRLESWLNVGPGSWLYGWLVRRSPAMDLGAEHEHRLGLGLLTAAAVVAGLVLERRRPAARVAAIAAFALYALTLSFPGGLTLWGGVQDAVPGAAAIRAPGRAALLVLYAPGGLALGWLVERAVARAGGRAWVALPIGALVLLEQGTGYLHFERARGRERVAALAARIDRGWDAFVFIGDADTAKQPWLALLANVDALWASLETGVPTLNGYGGRWPPGTRNFPAYPREDALRVVGEWIEMHGMQSKKVGVVGAGG